MPDLFLVLGSQGLMGAQASQRVAGEVRCPAAVAPGPPEWSDEATTQITDAVLFLRREEVT